MSPQFPLFPLSPHFSLTYFPLSLLLSFLSCLSIVLIYSPYFLPLFPLSFIWHFPLFSLPLLPYLSYILPSSLPLSLFPISIAHSYSPLFYVLFTLTLPSFTSFSLLSLSSASLSFFFLPHIFPLFFPQLSPLFSPPSLSSAYPYFHFLPSHSSFSPHIPSFSPHITLLSPLAFINLSPFSFFPLPLRFPLLCPITFPSFTFL